MPLFLILFIMHSQWINENRHAIYGMKWMNKVYVYVCYTLLKDLFDHKKGQIRIHCIWSNWSNRNWNRRMEMIWANCSMTDVLKLSQIHALSFFPSVLMLIYLLFISLHKNVVVVAVDLRLWPKVKKFCVRIYFVNTVWDGLYSKKRIRFKHCHLNGFISNQMSENEHETSDSNEWWTESRKKNIFFYSLNFLKVCVFVCGDRWNLKRQEKKIWSHMTFEYDFNFSHSSLTI